MREVKILDIMCFLVQGTSYLGKGGEPVACGGEVLHALSRDYYNYMAFKTTFYIGILMHFAEKLSLRTRDE